MVKISISVTNDIFNDQRVLRTVQTLCGQGYAVRVTGRSRKSRHTISTYPCPVKRFRLVFQRGPLFYAEYNIRLLLHLLFVKNDIFLSCDLDTLVANFLAARLKRKPLVYDSHEFFTEVPELVGRPFTKRIWESIEKRILPHVRHSYTVSQPIADAYRMKYGIRMEIICNYPVKRKHTGQPAFSLKKGHEYIILYQGSVNLGRGLELAIKAMRYTDNARLVIIGDGDIMQRLKLLVAEEGLTDRVTFPGRIAMHDLFYLTIQADLGISLEEDLGLNYRYALPNKLFDYIQAGVPVLVSDLPEMATIVNQYGVGRTVSTTDPHVLAAGFNEMLAHSDDRVRWKANAIKASEELCWEKEEGKLVALFEKVIVEMNGD
jgi:glycosyltransferase involved in cell wall biosynthesis